MKGLKAAAVHHGRRLAPALGLVAGAAIVAMLSSCGRYARPLPPEAVSPAAVKDLKVQGSLDGVAFTWTSPSTDRRGKELNELDGYVVERKTIVNRADVVDNDVEFEKLATIEDLSVKTLKKEQEALRAQEKPSHRAKIDPALTQFKYTDKAVVAGTQYVYRIVPQSYNGDGSVKQFIRVLFRGDASEIALFSGADLDGDLTDGSIDDSPSDE